MGDEDAPLDSVGAELDAVRELQVAGRHEEALEATSAVLTRFGEYAHPEARRAVVEALVARTQSLSRLGRGDEAVAAIEDALARAGEPREPEDEELLARALHARTSVAVDQGRVEEALAGYRELAERFGGSDDPRLRRTGASAMRSAGYVLLRGGDSSRALAVFDDVVARFGEDSDVEVSKVVAAALVNRGQLLLQEGRNDEALDALAEVARRFADATDPFLREAAAGAMVQRAELLFAAERDREGIDQVEEVMSRYGSDSAPRMREIMLEAGVALKRREAELPAADPTSDPLAVAGRAWFVRGIVVTEIARLLSPVVFSIAVLAVLALRPGGRVPTTVLAALLVALGVLATRTARRYRYGFVSRLGALVALQDMQANELYDSHKAATRILGRFAEEGAPFALFLRNFDIEMRQRRIQRGGKEWVISSDNLKPGSVETKVAEHLTPLVPVIAVANPSLLTKRPLGLALPYLSLPDDGWKETVEALVDNAALIVVELSEMTAGVSFELETILARGAEDRAVLLLPGTGSLQDLVGEQGISLALEGAFGGAGADEVEEEYADVEARAAELRAQLVRFPRVVAEAEIPFDDLDSSPLFHDLLERTRAPAGQG